MERSPKSPSPSPYAAMAIVGELGYLIAIPAFLFGFGGAYLDKYLGSSPAFVLMGLLLALCISAVLVWRMIKRVMPAKPSSKAS